MIDRKTAIMMAMGFEIVGVVITAILIGGWLDKTFYLNNLGTAIAIGVGFLGWLVHVVVVAKMVNAPSSSTSDNDKNCDGDAS